MISAIVDILRLTATVIGVWCLMAVPMVSLILSLEFLLWVGEIADDD